MTQPVHRSEQTGNPALDRIQNSVRNLFAALRLVPFLFGGKFVSVTFAANTRKVVRHGLGIRAACIVIRGNYDAVGTGASLAENPDQTTGCDPIQQLALWTDAACTLDLWFYPRASRDIVAAQGQSL